MKIEAVVLGVGAPNTCSSGDKTMCAILLSKEIGLFRVYPISGECRFPVWSNVQVELEEPKSDPRHESYHLTRYEIKSTIKDRHLKQDILESCVLGSGTHDPIDFQNAQRSSIVLVKASPNSLGMTLISQPAEDDGDWVMTQSKAPAIARLNWQSMQGGNHKNKIVSREVFEWVRRNPTSIGGLIDNLQIYNRDFEKWILLGNMKNQLNAWVVVHIHRLKKTSHHFTPSFCDPMRGSADDWPYLKQRESNVSVADDQLLMFTT